MQGSQTDPAKLFLIEPNPTQAASLTQLLSAQGYQVKRDLNRSHPLSALLAAPPDLILLSLSRPDMDGAAFCQRLRAVADLAAVPMLVLGGLDQISDRLSILRAGATDYMQHPWDPEELLIRVAYHASLRQQTQQLHRQINQVQEELRQIYTLRWFNTHRRQQAVIDLANRLRTEMTARIHQHLTTFMEVPHTVNQINRDAIEQGWLDLTHFPALEYHFWKQLQRFPQVNALQFANVMGDYIAVVRMEDGSFSAEVKDYTSPVDKLVYAMTATGQRTHHQLGFSQNYDPRKRSWYVAALQAGQPTWSDFYQYSTNVAVQIGIMAVIPIYTPAGDLLGVLGADSAPWQISDFLRDLSLRPSSLTFIMEQSGLLVTSTTTEPTFHVEHGIANLTPAINSSEELIRTTAEFLMRRFGSLQAITSPQQLDYKLRDQRQYVQVLPFHDAWGLSWLIVLVVPESDLVERSRTEATEQLQQAFAALEHSNHELEEKVKHRTAELRAANEAALQAAQAAEAANRAKSDFLATISHELRTPLNAIIGMTQLLQLTPLALDQQEFARTIDLSGQTLLALINDVLDFSKMEANRLDLEVQSLSLSACVEEALNLVAPKAAEKRLELRQHFDPQIPSRIQADATRLKQILVNLLSNAVKFTQQGEVSITVKARSLPQPQMEELCFAIRDTGIGIPADRLDRLFQPFSQVDSSVTRQFGGTGLGLAISQRLAEKMRGRIEVETKVGEGSTFSLLLPVTVLAREEPDLTLPSPPGTPIPPSGSLGENLPLQILVAEDNPVNQKVILALLKRLGYEADLVNNGLETLAALKHRRYDLVLMDVQMPELDGLDATRQIVQTSSPDQRPWIIALTANAMQGDRETCLQAGMNDYLNKPLRLEALSQAIHRYATSGYGVSPLG